eukprot:TRINITY_DN22625_c0_g1_i1.p1 TRINITY_DN22625_c0_g1~~TRINITY_DN22625_c0_g1_i1.p1  ORF type:complete len:380 (-),score=72.82 TRINITY_DN22625_c0_g1_i1:44-1012(-)
MSHGVVCIPVLGLPPLSLAPQIAIGSTVFGVAARQGLSAALLSLDPNIDAGSADFLDELVDVPAASALAIAGTGAALSGAALVRMVSQKRLRRANGAFMMGVAAFLQWREAQAKAAKEAKQRPAFATGSSAATTDASVASAGSSEAAASAGRAAGDAGSARQLVSMESGSPRSSFEWPRYLVLGAASGFVLGFFGVGPAWMLAPLVARTAPSREGTARGQQKGAAEEDEDDEVLGSVFGSDDRIRRTCGLAMVPPCLAAAWRHWRLGHVPNASTIALPLAGGAVLGSAVGGSCLEDVPVENDVRFGLTLLIFAYGAWSLFKP